MLDTAKPLDAVRLAKAIRVLGLTGQGRTITQACEEIGDFTPAQYRYWIRRGGDAIDALRTFMVESEREQLSQIIVARQNALDRIIERVDIEPSLDLMLKADQHLRLLQRELEDRHGAHGIDDTAAKEFILSGPQLKTETSRLVSVNISINEESPVVIDIEDAEFKEPDAHNNEPKESNE